MWRDDITITRDRGYSQKYTLTQKSDGAPINLDGATIRSQVRKTAKQTSDLIFEMVATITDPTNGIIDITLPAATSKGEVESLGYHDIVITYSTGVPETEAYGVVRIEDKPSELPGA